MSNNLGPMHVNLRVLAGIDILRSVPVKEQYAGTREEVAAALLLEKIDEMNRTEEYFVKGGLESYTAQMAAASGPCERCGRK